MMDIGQGQARQDAIAALLTRCAHGDTSAFQRLYEQKADALHAVALAITKDPALAADALHDAFVQIWKNAGRYSPSVGGGWTWIVSLTRYRSIDAVNRAGREITNVELPDMPDTEIGPLEQLTQASEVRRLDRCMGGLEDVPRRLVRMAYLGGMTHAELATHVKQPLGTVKSLIRRTLMKLRDCMDGRR